jgi:GAF domain-containing protein
MSTGDDGGELARRFDHVRRTLEQQRTLPAKLEALAGLLLRTVPGCDAVSVALVVQGTAGTGAFATEIAIEADLAQYRTGDGPCLLAMSEAHPVRIDVLEHEEHFEHFAPLALESGIESVLSIPLEHEGRIVGSLNLYSCQANAFSDETVASQRAIAEYAAETIASSPLYHYTLELLDELEITQEERARISTAVGMLMTSHGCDQATALTLLRRAADEEGRSLAEAADVVILAHAGGGGLGLLQDVGQDHPDGR